MKLNGRVVIWPRYFDGTRARSAGRRLPTRLCIEKPKVEELATIAERLGLNPEVRATAAHPQGIWERSGCLIVDKRGSKTKVLNLLAVGLVKQRADQI